MPGQCRAEFEVDAAVDGIACQHRIGACDHGGAHGVVLHPGVGQCRLRSEVDMGDGVGQMGVRGTGEVMLDHAELRALAQLDQVTDRKSVV